MGTGFPGLSVPGDARTDRQTMQYKFHNGSIREDMSASGRSVTKSEPMRDRTRAP